MTGLTDDIGHSVSRGQHVLSLSGRDEAAVLVDCSAPVFSAMDMTLDEVIQRIVRPLGINRIALHANAARAPKKFSVEPGETAWNALKKTAEANGLWAWFSPDGTLIIGGPDYSVPPVDTLSLHADGSGNVLSLSHRTSIAGRYSKVTVLSQSHGHVGGDGVHNRHGEASDPSFHLNRPLVHITGDTDSDEEAAARARKLLSDSRLNGLTITAVVQGIRTRSGVPWSPGQRVAVKSDIHGIDGIFFMMSRTFRGGRGMTLTTELTLKEDGVWIPDAYPKSHHHEHHHGHHKSHHERYWSTLNEIE